MSEPIWNEFLTERDKEVFARAGYGQRQGFGKRPALLIVDVNYNFCGDRPEPILESIKRWRNSCGEEAWTGVKAIKRLLAAGRAKGLPVIYTTGVRRPDNWDSGSWAWKNNRTRERASASTSASTTGLSGDVIVPDIAPEPRDIVIHKQKPSAFYGTPLVSYLTLLGADSVILAGTTTSGCVRATVLDAFSNNYRVTLVEEGCFDRSQASHAINLCDMHAKYADVVKLEEVVAFIGTLAKGLFVLPMQEQPAARQAGSASP
jgi:nicotinamidase-related amidase